MKSYLLISLMFLALQAFCQSEDSLLMALRDIPFPPEVLERLQDRSGALIGNEIPAFHLSKLNWDEFNSDMLWGKPTVLFFWSMSHQSCMDKIPYLMELKSQYDGRVNFVGISKGNRAETQHFLSQRSFDITHLIDDQNYNDQVGNIGVSRAIVLDENLIVMDVGKIRKLPTEWPPINNTKKNPQAWLTQTIEWQSSIRVLLDKLLPE